jgi:drug/metabolite transporter (DMT)-like permease
VDLNIDDPTRRRSSMVGATMVAGAALLFGANGTVSRLALDAGFGSLRLVQFRCTLAAVAFLVAAAIRDRAALRVQRSEWPRLTAYGVIGLAATQWLYLVAIGRMPVSVTLLIEFTAPLYVALWVRFVRRQPVRGRLWWALAVCLAGLAMVAQVWDGLTLDGIGVLAAFGSASALAAYYLLGEQLLVHRRPLPLAALSFAIATLFWSLVQPWWSAPWSLLTERVDLGAATAGVVDLELPMWTLLVWIVVLGTVVPFWLMLGGLQRVGPTRAGLLGTLEPVFAGVIAWIILDQVLTPVQLIGGTVVLVGVVLAETSRRSPSSSRRHYGASDDDERCALGT